MKKINIGYIGSGPISNFHIPALSKVGLKITLFYSRNFKKAFRFSKLNNIVKPEKSLNQFIFKTKNIDAFIVSINPKHAIKYINILSSLNKPIFVEKPGSIKSKDLMKIERKIKNKIYFLYNRRFYISTLEGKKFVENSKSCFVSVKIPDSVKSNYNFISNGCHVIDLLFYYFKNLKLIKSYKLKKNLGYYFLLQSKRKDLISCLLNWGSPQNFEINLYNENFKRLELKPFEKSFLYYKMVSLEPSKKNPIREYFPRLIKKKSELGSNLSYKPGFIEQYKEVSKVIKTKKNHKLTDLSTAIKILQLIETIIKKSK